jgi:cytochrome o ubiquinol oxidase subunit IV
MSAKHLKDYGTHNKTFSVYTIGFLLCIVLTLIPFYVVINKAVSKPAILEILLVSAILQFFVQVVCFLRFHGRTEQGLLNIYTFSFTGIVLLVIVGGSLWIMHNLNYFMMN